MYILCGYQLALPVMFLVVRLLLVCLPLTLAAQQPLQYTRLTAENGLSNNSVQCILQDKHGIVWIGTNGGLNRYDGASFIQYSLLSTPALTNNVVTALMQDADGYLWIGTENGLNILRPATNTFQQFVHNNTVAGSLPPGPHQGHSTNARQQYLGFVRYLDREIQGPQLLFSGGDRQCPDTGRYGIYCCHSPRQRECMDHVPRPANQTGPKNDHQGTGIHPGNTLPNPGLC